MIEYLKKTDKLIVLSLLVKVMDADEIQDPKELEFLEGMKKWLELTSDDEEEANLIPLEKCRNDISKFSDDQRKEVKDILVGMAESDGYYAPVEKELIESLKLDISHFELELIADWRDKEQIIIGYYSQTKDDGYCFEDIRSLGFSELTYKGGEEISIPTERIEGLEENSYYEFSWTVALDESERGFHIVPKDNSFKKVKPKELVDRLYAIWENSNLDVIKQLSDVQRMVNTQLTASSDGTFIYELLQNANDYPVIVDGKIELVDVEFHLTDRYLIYRHTGRRFSPRNIAAISKMSAGEKKKAKNAIGYKGIGFKTVFSENQYVFLESGEYTLRFDESITQESSRFPWQIMPIWTEYSEVDEEVKEVMSDEQNFRVQMAIRPDDSSKLHDAEKSYEFIFNDIFTDEKDILFIPNIKSVKVFYDGEEKICRTKDPEKWTMTREPLVYQFSPEEIEANNQERIVNKRIPDKYKDFEDTRVSFACRRDGNKLIPVEKSKIYCYLPTQVSLGFPFLMNTDMIPTGPRDDIEKKIKFNHKLMKIAGGKLAEWINILLRSGDYDLCSVFTIIPSFDEVENYEDFIEEFKEGFDEALETIEIIPGEGGDYSLIKDVIIDETGITSSGILSDDEFMQFANLEGMLPIKELREDDNFKEFVKEYIDDENVFDTDSLHDMIESDEFKDWLEVQENNNRFIEFLLENDLLDDFISEDIFIGKEDGLYSASELYEDVDDYLEDLQAFESLINRLSSKTREYFKDNEKWHQTIESEFKKFDCADFVDNNLLSNSNKSDTKETLRDKETSIKFYKFLAEHVGYSSRYKELPFFDDNDEEVDDFNDKFIFLSSDEAHKVCDSEWLKSIDIVFLSNDYSNKTREYLTENFGVQEYSNNTIVKDIILSDDYHDTIVDDLDEDIDISKSFIDYCFANKELFKSGELKDYPLCVIDGDGDEQWCLSEDHIYFASHLYESYAEKEWIEDDWMYQLDNAYIEGSEQKDELKQFIASTFKVKELTDKLFYVEVVKKHLHDIFSLTSGNNDSDGTKNIDFVKYLDDNYNLIFEELRDDREFKDFQPVSSSSTDLSLEDNVYIYNAELAEIIENEWFPKDIVWLCNKEYGNSKALKAIGCKEYNYRVFYTDVIVKEIVAINDVVDSKEKSLAFHSFIIQHLGALDDGQRQEMRKAKVYLYGNDEPSSTSKGHKILSASAKELCDKGLVEFSDLDIIDPDYKTEGNNLYWETILGNTKFTIKSFFNWLKDNQKTFADTLQDEQLNIVFWRWMKDNTMEKGSESLPRLPLLLKDGTIDNDSPIIYFADEYMQGAGIESLVKSYDENSLFISPLYIREDDNIEDWKKVWLAVGLKYKIVDFLTETINDKLAEIENEDLPKLIANNREELERVYSNNLVSHLSKLRVKAHDGKFYPIGGTIYIDCEKSEPFPYIELPNQISFSSAEERRLIKDILQRVGGGIVSTYSEWLQRKLDCYLNMQDDDVESIRNIHYQFVNDLSIIRDKERETLKEFEGLAEIKLLNREDEFCEASTLTMGTIYKPFFDFELCEIDFDYVSDSYRTECTEYVGKLFREIGIHCDFQEEDIEYLENRKCAMYFWKTYINSKDAALSRIRRFEEDGLLDDITCIPTKDVMKCPQELYFGSEVDGYVTYISNWENKKPLVIPEDSSLFELLNFKSSLDFLDALDALIPIRGKEKRKQLLKWIIEGYNVSYNDDILRYRENQNALWFNNKNQSIQIQNLYALDNQEKKLEQYFGANPRIINKDYLPGGDSFRKACDILGITTISPGDLKMEPVGEDIYRDYDNVLKLYALVIAGISDIENWKNIYESYVNLLSQLVLYKCQSIKITYKYDEDVSQSLKKFYHDEGKNIFYFVKSLDDKRVYKSFVEEYIEFLGINTDNISEDVIEDIMDCKENAIEIVKEYNKLMLIDEFKDELTKLCPDIVFDGIDGPEGPDEPEGPKGPQGPDEPKGPQGPDRPKGPQGPEGPKGPQGPDEPKGPQGPDEPKGPQGPDEPKGPQGPDEPKGPQGPDRPKGPQGPDEPKGPQGPDRPKEPKELDGQYREYERQKYEQTIKDFLEGAFDLSQYSIHSEHIITRYRILQYLKEQYSIADDFDQKAYVGSGSYEQIKLQNGKYVNPCSAKWGVWFIHPNIWRDIIDNGNWACICTGNDENDFEMIKSFYDLKELAKRANNVLMRMNSINKDDIMDVIGSVFPGEGNASKNIHLMIKMHETSNREINSIFDKVYKTAQDDFDLD